MSCTGDFALGRRPEGGAPFLTRAGDIGRVTRLGDVTLAKDLADEADACRPSRPASDDVAPSRPAPLLRGGTIAGPGNDDLL